MNERTFAAPNPARAAASMAVAVILLAIASAPTYARAASSSGATGFDVSYPQCSSAMPRGGAFGIVGVTDGLPWSSNPCLASEWSWAASRPQAAGLYVNVADPGPVSKHWNLGGPRACLNPSSYADTGCAYDYGWNSAADAYARAVSALGSTAPATHAWWLDVETGNSWNGSTAANTADIQGARDYLVSRTPSEVGLYSTGYQWGVITGGAAMPAPNWVAGASSLRSAQKYCGRGFSSAPVRLVQYPSGSFDGDYVCP